MADTTDATSACHWLAIDVGRCSNAVLIETAAGQRHRFKMMNKAEDFDRLVSFLQGPGSRVRADLKPTGDYHRALAHRLALAGVAVVSISSVALRGAALLLARRRRADAAGTDAMPSCRSRRSRVGSATCLQHPDHSDDRPDTMLSRDELLFRRQFVIGPTAVRPTNCWSTTNLLHGLTLSVHRDLPLAVQLDSDAAIVLLGRAVHVKESRWTEAEIVDHLHDDGGDFQAFCDALDLLAGRWVALLQCGGRTYLQTDACGFRQVHYATVDGVTWAASQPALLDTVLHLRPDDDPGLREFLQSPAYAAEESAWVGDGTIYRGCRRLLPNHWLDLGAATTGRRRLARRFAPLSTSEAVDASAAMLRSIMDGVCARERVSLAVTAGLDSRILLAAARPAVQRIDLFVDRMGRLDDDDADIWVPRELCRRLGLSFEVRDSGGDLPDWFRSMLAANVTGARILPKTRSIFGKLLAEDSRLNINGNGGEICRNYYDKYARGRPRPWSVDELAGLMGYAPAPGFVTHALESWLRDLSSVDRNDWNLPDLLYWEQRIGVWGAQYPAEQDIAVDEFSPFDCRALLEAMYAAPRRDRAAPRYPFFRDLIRALWPEALELPVNPPRRGDHLARARQWLRPYVPDKAVRWVKRLAQ